MRFSVFLTTIGRSCLATQLSILRPQLKSEDILYIAIDGRQYFDDFKQVFLPFENTFQCQVEIIWEENNLGYWGHGLRNKYQKSLKGDYILHADDDNFYTSDAFNHIRKNVQECGKLYVFQIGSKFYTEIFPKSDMVKVGDIDTSSGVVANVPEKMGTWAHVYGGDGMFYVETSKKFGSDVVFVKEMISVLCPETKHPSEDLSISRKGCPILPTGCFVGAGNLTMAEHLFDSTLGKALIEFFHAEKNKSNNNQFHIVDLGCGKADYVRLFRLNGLSANGYDGNPDTFQLSGGVAKVLNISERYADFEKADWVMSLEVGEHIPPCFERIVIDNICKNASTGLVISWALPGQLGHGHVNCRTNEYIQKQIESRGFRRDNETELKLRECASLYWFKNTIMVYYRNIEPLTTTTSTLIKVSQRFSKQPPPKWRQSNHWCRIVMNEATEKLMMSYLIKRNEANLKCLEISGDDWKNSGLFSDYTSKGFPSFDITSTMISDTRYDVIIAEQVWEHIKYPHRATRNVYNMLNAQGAFLLSVPFLIQIHEVPGDYSRWTAEGLKYLLMDCGFDEKSIIVGSWGNRECIKDSFYSPWSNYQPHHSLQNEPDFPIVVWALAIKGQF